MADYKTNQISCSSTGLTLGEMKKHNKNIEEMLTVNDETLVESKTEGRRMNVRWYLTKVVIRSSLFSMVAGVVGMLYCFPNLFSSVMANITSEGLLFIGGASLFMAGWISLSIQTKK